MVSLGWLTVNSIAYTIFLALQLPIIVTSLSDYEIRRNFIRHRINPKYFKEHKELPTQDGKATLIIFQQNENLNSSISFSWRFSSEDSEEEATCKNQSYISLFIIERSFWHFPPSSQTFWQPRKGWTETRSCEEM